MQWRVRALVDRHQSIAGGLTRRGCAQEGVVQLGGHDGAQNARGAHGSRSSEPLVRLKHQDGRRLLPIGMVVMLALHHQRQTCATGRAISSRSGQCSGSKQSWGALEAGRSAGGRIAAGAAHRGAPPGDHAGKGGARSPSELSAAKGLLCVFALAHPTQCSPSRWGQVPNT